MHSHKSFKSLLTYLVLITDEMVYKTLFYGAIFRVWIYKMRVFETDKNNFLHLFVLFTGYYTGSVNSLLATSIKTGLCSLSSYSTGCIWSYRHTVLSVLLILLCCLRNVTLHFLAQLCHFFLSSGNTICDITSTLPSAKLSLCPCRTKLFNFSESLGNIFVETISFQLH